MSRSLGTAIPEPVRNLLDGGDLEARIGLTIQLLTSDEGGWVSLALLSVGEVLVPGPSEVRLALWPGSSATRNLKRNGRATLAVVHDGDAYYLRLRAGPSTELRAEGARLTRYDAEVVDVLWDHVDYARITSGLVFELADPAATVRRWEAVIGALRAPSEGA